MKRYLLALLNLFICGVIIVLLLFPISELLEPKRIYQNDAIERLTTKGLYNEKKNTIDVLFLGDSNVYSGVSPMVLWDKYGIASYVYGSPGQRTTTSYYLLRDALNYQHPKTVVLNVETMFETKPHASGSSARSFDDMENLSLKTEVIFNKDIQSPIAEKVSYIFKVFRYHDRYRELTSDDFEYAYKTIHNPLKGYNLVTESKPSKKKDNYLKTNKKTSKINPLYKKYLDKIRELCNKENIQLILIEIPSEKTWNEKRSKVIKEYADKYNLKFYDLNYENVGLDWKKDSVDGGTHLNLFGATKVSQKLGSILKKLDTYKDRRNDKNYESWNEDSEVYRETTESYLKKYNKKS